MAGLRLEAWAFFANWASVTLVLLVAQSFGLLIGKELVGCWSWLGVELEYGEGLRFFGVEVERAKKLQRKTKTYFLPFFFSLFSPSLPPPPNQSPSIHLLGATVMVPKTAQTITSVIMLTMMLVGGFYVTNIPAWIAWLKYLSFVYYGYNLLLKIEYSGVTLYSCRSNDSSTAGGPAGVVVKNPERDTDNCVSRAPGGTAGHLAPAGKHRDLGLGGDRAAGVAGGVQVRDLLGAEEEDELDGEEVRKS